MARPTRPKLTPEEQGAVNLIAWGRATVGEAAAMLQVHRATMSRMCAAQGVRPSEARRAYLQRQQLSLTWYGRRPMTKADMTARTRQAIAAYEHSKSGAVRDFAVSDQPSTKTDTKY